MWSAREAADPTTRCTSSHEGESILSSCTRPKHTHPPHLARICTQSHSAVPLMVARGVVEGGLAWRTAEFSLDGLPLTRHAARRETTPASPIKTASASSHTILSPVCLSFCALPNQAEGRNGTARRTFRFTAFLFDSSDHQNPHIAPCITTHHVISIRSYNHVEGGFHITDEGHLSAVYGHLQRQFGIRGNSGNVQIEHGLGVGEDNRLPIPLGSSGGYEFDGEKGRGKGWDALESVTRRGRLRGGFLFLPPCRDGKTFKHELLYHQI